MTLEPAIAELVGDRDESAIRFEVPVHPGQDVPVDAGQSVEMVLQWGAPAERDLGAFPLGETAIGPDGVATTDVAIADIIHLTEFKREPLHRSGLRT